MTANSPTSPATAGRKRARPSSPERSPPEEHKAGSPPSSSYSSSSSFRNVSACNRCRLRKNRCDQHLPACASCEKAHVKCVGYDPITKREIPRRCVLPSYYIVFSEDTQARMTISACACLHVSP